jgi:urease accessory protein
MGTVVVADERVPASGLPLLVWTSPAFPVGSFAYSHGLEWAVEAGDVRDAATLTAWLDDLLDHGAVWSDAVLLAEAHHAVTRDDAERLGVVAELAVALGTSRERRLETTGQGGAFMAACRAGWPCVALDRFASALAAPVAFPVAFGVAAAGHRLELLSALEAYLLGVLSNLVSAAVRLVPLGQTDGVRVVARCAAPIRTAAARAATTSLDDLGTCALRSDVASMRHETQHTRLFRS